jgi:hypothetical protein
MRVRGCIDVMNTAPDFKVIQFGDGLTPGEAITLVRFLNQTFKV